MTQLGQIVESHPISTAYLTLCSLSWLIAMVGLW